MATELVTRIVGELPVVGTFAPREQMIVAAWLTGLPSANTRRSYARDAAAWLAWCAERGIDPFVATRVHVDMWVMAQLDAGYENSTICRRLSALSGLATYCVSHGFVSTNPTVGVNRPAVDRDFTKTVSLSRDESRALISAADADTGPQRLRNAVVIRLLLHNGFRVATLCNADLKDLGVEQGHQILTVTNKGGKRYKSVVTPATMAAIQTYLAERATEEDVAVGQLKGPLVATRTGKRLDQAAVLKLIQRLAKSAGIPSWSRLTPHSLRHASITHYLAAGGTLEEAQDHAGHGWIADFGKRLQRGTGVAPVSIFSFQV